MRSGLAATVIVRRRRIHHRARIARARKCRQDGLGQRRVGVDRTARPRHRPRTGRRPAAEQTVPLRHREIEAVV